MSTKRDELIDRARAQSCAMIGVEHLADGLAGFALAEGRRWVAEELEAIRSAYPMGIERSGIDARLAALRDSDDEAWARERVTSALKEGGEPVPYAVLRAEQTEQPNTAPPTTEDSQRRVAPGGSDLGGAVSREANLLSSNPLGGQRHASSGLAATSTYPGATFASRGSAPYTDKFGGWVESQTRAEQTDKPGAESQTLTDDASERDEGRAASSPCPPPAVHQAAGVWAAVESAVDSALSRAKRDISVTLGQLRNECAPPPSSAESDARAPMSDADALERVSKLLQEERIKETSPGALMRRAAALRAASAPKPVDVFVAFFLWAHGSWNVGERARDWFGPLVAALEQIEYDSYEEKTVGLASSALESLRRRAQEASR